MNAIAALKSTRRICFDRLINAQRKEIRTMSGLNALKMRQEPKRGAKLAEKLKCEKSSIHYLSILNGNTRGLVWTDDPTAPRLAVVYSYLLGGFQIMGTPLQTAEEYAAFRLFFENKVFPLAKDEFELSEFAYSADTEELSDMMRVVFFDKELFEQKQLVYRTAEEYSAAEMPFIHAAEGRPMRIWRASESFLRENAEFAGAYLPEILESYKSFADFLKHGFAFFVLEGENICGNIISNGEYNGCCIVGADTKAEYRRRGIASALLRTAIESARERGNEIIWECAEENIPSVRTAESCGMHRCGEFFVRWFEFEPQTPQD